MTKWLADIVATVPADFVPSLGLSYAIPDSAEIIGPIPEEGAPLMRAYLYLLTEARNREDGTGVRRSAWENTQIQTVRLLLLTSVHYALNVTGMPIGIGPDPKDAQRYVVYRMPLDEESEGAAETDTVHTVIIARVR